MSGPRVLVTGGTGRVGREVVAEIARVGNHEIIALTRSSDPVDDAAHTIQTDLLSPQSVDAAFKEAQPDAVIHLAAIPSPGRHTSEELFRTNVMATFNMAEAAAEYGVKRFVYASSGASYGFTYRQKPARLDYLPVDENHPQRPQEAYSLSKQVGEKIVETFVRRTDASAASLRFPLVVSPEDWPTRGRSALLNQSPARALAYIDARDLARAFRLALEANLHGYEVFLIAADDALAMEPLATLIPRMFPGSDEFAAALTGTQPFMSAEKARRILAWVPQHTWRQELPDLAEQWPMHLDAGTS